MRLGETLKNFASAKKTNGDKENSLGAHEARALFVDRDRLEVLRPSQTVARIKLCQGDNSDQPPIPEIIGERVEDCYQPLVNFIKRYRGSQDYNKETPYPCLVVETDHLDHNGQPKIMALVMNFQIVSQNAFSYALRALFSQTQVSEADLVFVVNPNPGKPIPIDPEGLDQQLIHRYKTSNDDFEMHGQPRVYVNSKTRLPF